MIIFLAFELGSYLAGMVVPWNGTNMYLASVNMPFDATLALIHFNFSAIYYSVVTTPLVSILGCYIYVQT